LLLSEIDPVQNRAVNTAVNTAGFSETQVWSGQRGQCGNPSSAVGIVNTCYPPAVNYSPLYYLFNGVAFNKASAAASLFPSSPATGAAGSVLVRLVNAGLYWRQWRRTSGHSFNRGRCSQAGHLRFPSRGQDPDSN